VCARYLEEENLRNYVGKYLNHVLTLRQYKSHLSLESESVFFLIISILVKSVILGRKFTNKSQIKKRITMQVLHTLSISNKTKPSRFSNQIIRIKPFYFETIHSSTIEISPTFLYSYLFVERMLNPLKLETG
jgi:hypothetical protein